MVRPGAEGAGTLGGGICTGAVDGRAAGGGSGALGSWMGEVDLLTGAGVTGDVAVRGTLPVMFGTGLVPTEGTGLDNSLGWVTPAPGRARSVIRTVSFFSGTADVLAAGVGGGVGCVLLSLMVKNLKTIPRRQFCDCTFYLMNFQRGRQYLSPLFAGNFRLVSRACCTR